MLPDKRRPIDWLKHCYHRLRARPFEQFSFRRSPSRKRSQPTHISASSRRFGLWSGVAVAAVSAGVSAVDGWQVLELQSYNLLHRTRRAVVGAPDWDDRIVVIEIDDASTSELGRFPWPRQTHTELLEQLWSTQPAVVSFDVLFPDTTEEDGGLANAIINSANVVLAVADGPNPPLSVSPTIAEPANGFFLSGDISYQPDIDGISRRVHLYSHANPSLSVATLQVYEETMSGTMQADVDNQTGTQSDTQSQQHTESSRLNRIGSLNLSRSDISPSSTSSKAHNSVNAIGSSATYPPHSVQDSSQKTHSPSAFGLNHSEQPSDLTPPFSSISFSQSFKFATDRIKRLSDRIPDDKTLWISWPGEIGPEPVVLNAASNTASTQPIQKAPQAGQLQTYSYVDVLKGRIDNSRFQNKIVLIGATIPGVDPLRTPFQSHLPTGGVYLHAATIDNLLNKSFLTRPPKWQKTLLLAVLAIASTHLLQRQDVHQRLAVLVGFPLAWSSFAYAGFLMGWWLPVAAPLGTVALAGLVIQLREQQEKQQLMDIFSMNVSPGTASLIWQHKDAILHRGELAAQTLTATVLFMDIRGFSSIAETLPSHQLLPWLNQYFETMTDCIMEHGGMVDKYIGDAIMAVFGAPLPRTTPAEIQADAIAAISAALEMHKRLEALNLHLQRQQLPTIDFGIGIHTGPLTGGTVGSRHRLNYSVFGDTVNIAARIESMTKRLPNSAPFRMLISAETSQYTQANFPVELFRSGKLRGRQSSTDVYTLVDRAMSAAPVANTTIHYQPAEDTRAISA